MGQYCCACWCLLSVGVVCRRRLSSSVTLPAGGPAGRVGGRPPPGRPPGAWEVGRLTLHCRPVRLHSFRATPCCMCCCHMLCEGPTRSEEELATNIRGLESRVREQVRQCVSLSGTLCARLVPRHRARTSNIHSTGTECLSIVHTACEPVDGNQ